MFARDFWRTGRWHTTSIGDPQSDLYWVMTPNVTGAGQTSFTVTFSANVVCQAYLQWALNPADLGTANGWTNAPGETSFDYSTHVQSMTGLYPATTYYFRAIITDALGNTLTSSAFSRTTEGTSPPPPSSDPGYRYDLYGAGASGNFPVLGVVANETGQLYTGTPVAWNAANVKIVPTAYLNDRAGLVSWIMAQPNGASATSPTFIVFDSSGGGTGYGSGTSYSLDNGLLLWQSGTTVRKNLVFWGYNTRLDYTRGSTTNGLIGFQGGGWENVHVLGFELDGPGSGVPSYQTDGMNGASQHDMAVDLTSFSGFKMLDNYAHHCAELIAIREWHLGYYAIENSHNHYDGWAHGPYANDAEIGWNELYFSMNQGILVNSGWNVDIHHNDIHDIRQKPIDLEDPNRNYVGSKARRIVNLKIRDNRFGDWSWERPDPNLTWGQNAMSVISFEQSDWRSDPTAFTALCIDSYENVRITDNWFDGQPRGKGNPDAEIDILDWWQSGDCKSVSGRSGVALVAPPNWQYAVAAPKLDGFVITGNVSNFPQWLVDGTDCSRYWCVFINGTSITVADNDFQGMDFRIVNTTTITWNASTNGASTYTES